MKRKNALIMGIFLIVLLIGFGYAYLNTTLSINGITNVDANTWNVYWDNVKVENGSVDADAPIIDTNKTTVTFQVRLKKPGDFYEFTVDAKNDGSIDAMIDEVTKTTTIPEFINYSIYYDDDENTPIQPKQLLNNGTVETYRVRVEYRSDISADNLPDSAQSLNLSFEVTYVQADSTAQPVRNFLYELWYDDENIGMTIGEPIPENAVYYYKHNDLVASIHASYNFETKFFFKHKILNGIVTESYLAFIQDEKLYLLRGAVNESNLDSKPVFEANKATLISAFGNERCNILADSITCSTENIYATASITGGVNITYSYQDSAGGEAYIFPEGNVYFE